MSNKKGVLRHTIIGLVLSAVLVVPVTWAGYEEGMNAAKKGDYATALREWQPLAKQGHARPPAVCVSTFERRFAP